MYVKRTQEERANNKIQRFKAKRVDHYKYLRYKKLIAAVFKKIIEKDSLILSKEDYAEITKALYKTENYISVIRVRRMMTNPIAKNDIETALIQAFVAKGIKPLDKTVELVEKAESVAKNTSDYMQVARFHQDLLKLEPKTKVSETRQTTEFHKYRNPSTNQDEIIPVKVTKTLETEVSQTQENVSNQDKEVSQNDKNE